MRYTFKVKTPICACWLLQNTTEQAYYRWRNFHLLYAICFTVFRSKTYKRVATEFSSISHTWTRAKHHLWKLAEDFADIIAMLALMEVSNFVVSAEAFYMWGQSQKNCNGFQLSGLKTGNSEGQSGIAAEAASMRGLNISDSWNHTVSFSSSFSYGQKCSGSYSGSFGYGHKKAVLANFYIILCDAQILNGNVE